MYIHRSSFSHIARLVKNELDNAQSVIDRGENVHLGLWKIERDLWKGIYDEISTIPENPKIKRVEIR